LQDSARFFSFTNVTVSRIVSHCQLSSFTAGHVVVPESKAGMKILIRQIKTVNRFTHGCLQKQRKGTLPKAFCSAPGELAQKRAES